MKMKAAVVCFVTSLVYCTDGLEYVVAPFPKNNNITDVLLEESKTINRQKDCQDLCERTKSCMAYAFSSLAYRCLTLSDVPYFIPNRDPKMNVYVPKKPTIGIQKLVGGAYMRLVTERRDLKSARKFCQKEGGDVAKIKNAEMNDEFLKMMDNSKIWQAYFDLTDEFEEGTWLYFDGKKPTYLHWDAKGMWNRKEKNCAILNLTPQKTWSQENCRNLHFFFCAYPVA